MRLEDSFKETDFGPIPVEWDMHAIEDVITDTLSGDWGEENNDEHPDWVQCQVIRGTDFPVAAMGQFASVPQRYIRPSSIGKRQLQSGDMLVEISGGSKDQPTGRILHVTSQILASAQLPTLFTNFVKLLRVDEDMVVPSFFHLFWEYTYNLGRTRIYEKRTTGIHNFKYKDFLANEIIPLPPLPEQRRIAHVLSTIQRAIAAQDALITAARELKRSLMQRLFAYGPGPEPAPTKATEIGEMPEHWDLVNVGETGEVITGTTPSTKVLEYYDGPYMFISPGDIGEAKYVKQTQKYLAEKGLEVSRPLPKDTVLMVCIGATIGKTAMTFAERSATNQQINAIVTNERVFSHYLYFALSHRSHHLPSLASRTAVPIVNKSNFSKFLVAIPPLSEQKGIADILSAADCKIEVEEQRKAALQALFKTMLHQLMTGQVRLRDIEFEG